LGELASKQFWRNEGKGSAAVWGGYGYGKDDVVYGDDAMVTTVSVFEDHTAAKACYRRIMDFIRHNVGPMLASQPVAFAGTVIVHTAG